MSGKKLLTAVVCNYFCFTVPHTVADEDLSLFFFPWWEYFTSFIECSGYSVVSVSCIVSSYTHWCTVVIGLMGYCILTFVSNWCPFCESSDAISKGVRTPLLLQHFSWDRMGAYHFMISLSSIQEAWFCLVAKPDLAIVLCIASSRFLNTTLM